MPTDYRFDQYSTFFPELSPNQWLQFWTSLAHALTVMGRSAYYADPKSCKAATLAVYNDTTHGVIGRISHMLLADPATHTQLEWLNRLAQSAQEAGIGEDFAQAVENTASSNGAG